MKELYETVRLCWKANKRHEVVPVFCGGIFPTPNQILDTRQLAVPEIIVLSCVQTAKLPEAPRLSEAPQDAHGFHYTPARLDKEVRTLN